MKNQLLLGSALLASVIAVAQNSGARATVRPIDLNKYLMNKVSTPTEPPIQALAPIANPTQPSVVAKTTASTSIVWNAFTGSMNIFGVLTTDQKPLQYNDELNTVSFIHRKSPTYVSDPVASPSTAASGVIVGMFTTNWGNTWDSTAIWNNNVQHARYPQGGIYNPPGNTSLSNAYVVVTGPVTSAAGTGWVGNYAASKKLDVFSNKASTVTAAQQFFDASAPTASVLGRLSFLRNDFHSPEDGRVWAMASIFDDPAGTTIATQGWRGARILKGTFNSTTNTFDWTSDSIKPPVVITTTAGSSAGLKNAPMLLSNRMAWSESGQVGYVYFMGSLQGRTGRNVGIQPIVYRTIDHGATWHPIDGINFNDTAYYNKPVLRHIPGTVLDTTLKIPFFLESSDTPGIDAIVDADNNLHIAATVAGTTKKSTDSLLASSFTFSLSSDNEEGYSFGHVPGLRPYVYDFICKPSSATSTASGSTWSVVVVDSMSTEAPGTGATDAGVNDNPWNVNPDGNTKAPVSPRLQLSRTSNGKYIVFTWSESDTIFTNGVRKWNSMPDIKARVMDVTRGYTVNPIEINLTTPDNGFVEPGVSTKAFMQYVSPECKMVAEYPVDPNLGVTGVELLLPVTVSNSSPLSQLTGNTHWYTSAALSFTWTTVGVAENTFESVKNSVIYPNPTKNNATLNINMKESSKVSVSVMNTVGQVVKTSTVSTVAGDNKIDVDVKGLASGIYLVNVTSGNSTSTKKLIVE